MGPDPRIPPETRSEERPLILANRGLLPWTDMRVKDGEWTGGMKGKFSVNTSEVLFLF